MKREVIDTITGIKETVIKFPYCKMEYSIEALMKTSKENDVFNIIDALETIGMIVDKNKEYGIFWYN